MVEYRHLHTPPFNLVRETSKGDTMETPKSYQKGLAAWRGEALFFMSGFKMGADIEFTEEAN